MTPEALARLRVSGRAAALKRWAEQDPVAGTERARDVFGQGFLRGHSCKACGDFVAIDQSLPLAEIQRRATLLYRRHFVQMGASRRRSTANHNAPTAQADLVSFPRSAAAPRTRR